MSEPLPEPWLRGAIPAIHPITAPLVFSLTQVREDVEKWTAGLSTEQIWARPNDVAAIGFHIRHIGGSAERLTVYLKGDQLSEKQLRAMKAEMEPGASREELLAKMHEQFEYTEAVVCALDPRIWTDARSVGRKALPTTVGGLVHHVAEHSQRHLGELIVTAKLVRAV